MLDTKTRDILVVRKKVSNKKEELLYKKGGRAIKREKGTEKDQLLYGETTSI